MKQCKDLTIVSFDKAKRWINTQMLAENTPVYIPKYGGRSDFPFRVWRFADVLLLLANERSATQTQYVLCKERWDSFERFVRENPELKMSDLAKSYKSFGCMNKVFWPAVISISKAYMEAKQ